jgi:hypothetical protein
LLSLLHIVTVLWFVVCFRNWSFYSSHVPGRVDPLILCCPNMAASRLLFLDGETNIEAHLSCHCVCTCSLLIRMLKSLCCPDVPTGFHITTFISGLFEHSIVSILCGAWMENLQSLSHHTSTFLITCRLCRLFSMSSRVWLIFLVQGLSRQLAPVGSFFFSF